MTVIRRGVEGWLEGTKKETLVPIPGIEGDGFRPQPIHTTAQPPPRKRPPPKPAPRPPSVTLHRGANHIVFWPNGTFTKGKNTIRLCPPPPIINPPPPMADATYKH